MVHRRADSRLLANVLAHEKDYAKHLHALLDPAHASISAFSAYASASTAPVSHAILAVATSLAGADDALGRYAAAVDECREHLKHIKALEDDVANIVRDREILVTRLIKASKSSKPKPHRELLPQPSSSSSSLSLSSASVFSSPSLTASLLNSPKLSAAQAELQACETHLAAKERDLAVGRTNALREGLSLRCRALVECGWVWSEMGNEALRVLDGLAEVNGDMVRNGPFHHSHKPLPQPQHRRIPSDLSSSASQDAMYIPPAHAISDNDPFPSPKRHVLSRRITEEELQQRQAEEEGGSSADEATPQDVQVIENPRFATPSPSKKETSTMSSTRDATLPSPSPSKLGRLGKRFSIRSTHPQHITRTRAASVSSAPSTGFFGSLRGMFGHHPSPSMSQLPTTSPAFYDAPGPAPEKKRGGGKWETRTEKNLRELERDTPWLERERRGRVVSDAGAGAVTGAPTTVSPSSSNASTARKLKKSKRSASVPLVGTSPDADAKDKAHPGATKRHAEQGVREGLTVTVVGRAASPRPDASTGVGRRKVSADSATSKRGERRSVLEPGKPMPSLLRIVHDAGVSSSPDPVHNRAPSAGGSVRRLGMEEVKAPGPVGRREVEAVVRGRSAERGGRQEPAIPIPRAPGSVFDMPAANGHAESAERRPAKSPLRSALRNPSRTPSPLPPPNLRGQEQVPPVPPLPQAQLQVPGQATGGLNGDDAREDDDDDDDDASVSSYETTHEMFFAVVEVSSGSGLPPHARVTSPSAGTTAPLPNGHAAHAPTSEAFQAPPGVPQKESSPPPPDAPRRRKSVRVSLQPTFSPTPPAIEYDIEEDDPWAAPVPAPAGRRLGAGEAPVWGKGKGKGKGRAGEVADMWEDSSEEDVEYTRARSLLSRLGMKEGRSRAGAGAAR
ncbi:hypothetical protein D9615_008597 [Tricholomella constricta]|uniref:Uncharacterized protein n=1 Tax=Tricholomella constricta TaxID=117010 RepID=A0A8H5H4B7_9AGAR|nr:hypothetical protein D9615_008597 [Tricholomella constricta]